MEDIYYSSNDGKSTIHAVIWRPEGKPVGIVQIIHGMCEYAARYSPFAQYLTEKGYLVCAEDHLGHGNSADEKDLGWFDDGHNYKTVLADIRALHVKISSENASLPYFVLGHSMGSFFCRNYIASYGSELSGAIIMGTGFKGKALMNFALFATRLNALFCGWRNKSKFIKSLAFGAYNKRFKADGDPNAWLSENRENVEKYNADRLCGFSFTDNGYYVLFSVIRAACSKAVIAAVPTELPVFFVSGAEDPVGDYGKGVAKACNKFIKAGKQASLKLYDNARHEILNDFCREQVQADILEFIKKTQHVSAKL